MSDGPAIRLLGDDTQSEDYHKDATKADDLLAGLGDALSGLGLSATQQQALLEQLGGAEAVEKAVKQLSAATCGPSVAELDEVTDCAAAQRLSSEHCRAVLNTGAAGAAGMLHPMMVSEAIEVAKQLARADDVATCGHHRSLLLPSGIVLHYQEFGKDSSPPVIMLHDINESRRVWYGVVRARSPTAPSVVADCPHMTAHARCTVARAGSAPRSPPSHPRARPPWPRRHVEISEAAVQP
jgi:hypothetical protein